MKENDVPRILAQSVCAHVDFGRTGDTRTDRRLQPMNEKLLDLPLHVLSKTYGGMTLYEILKDLERLRCILDSAIPLYDESREIVYREIYWQRKQLLRCMCGMSEEVF